MRRTSERDADPKQFVRVGQRTWESLDHNVRVFEEFGGAFSASFADVGAWVEVGWFGSLEAAARAGDEAWDRRWA